ncbi:MAG: hypothetical protein K8R90_03540 [Candidatus Cloacimonetes bacterium]|nr:hypothetical protein [Candidatus Cloacimonadota bacterium]
MDARRQILEMLAEGKVQPAEAMRLFEAVSSERPIALKKAERRLVVQVWQEDRMVFNLRIPVAIIRAGVRLLPRHSVIETQLGSARFDLQSIKWDEVIELIARGEVGEALHVEVDDADSGPLQVRIFCE